jgi:hypothetical protein
MSTNSERPQAKPRFRKLALGLAVVCYILAAVLVIAPLDNTPIRDRLLLGALGLLLVVPTVAGFWSQRSKR